MSMVSSIHDPLRADLIARIRKRSRPRCPLPTNAVPSWNVRMPIRAVLFDVYGTLLVSAAGDLSLNRDSPQRVAHFLTAAQAAGFSCDERAATLGAKWFHRCIEALHAHASSQGMDYPEVDIRDVWRDVLSRLATAPGFTGVINEVSLLTVAVEYELCSNPVWPMPHMHSTLNELHRRGLMLGIVSNAQFYTPLTLEALANGERLENLLAPRLCAWSWEHRVAKPSPRLFYPVLQELAARWDIRPHEVLYVGNDMVNDVWAAHQSGCQSAFFAGDARAIRSRVDDPRVADRPPDAVITDLEQLLGYLPDKSSR